VSDEIKTQNGSLKKTTQLENDLSGEVQYCIDLLLLQNVHYKICGSYVAFDELCVTSQSAIT
jgi:hypothetical protein